MLLRHTAHTSDACSKRRACVKAGSDRDRTTHFLLEEVVAQTEPEVSFFREPVEVNDFSAFLVIFQVGKVKKEVALGLFSLRNLVICPNYQTVFDKVRLLLAREAWHFVYVA